MLNFIKLSIVIVMLAVIATPIYWGVTKEHDKLEQSQIPAIDTDEQASLSFDEIYALADDNSDVTAEMLNNIETAAGNNTIKPDQFPTNGFSGLQDSALQDTPIVEPVIEQPSE